MFFSKEVNDLVYFKTRVPDTNDTSTTQGRHECYTNDSTAIRVRNFHFDNDTNENILQKTQPYISYMANEILQGEEQFHSKNYLSEMPHSHAKNAFEKCTTETELCNAKSYIKKLHTRL